MSYRPYRLEVEGELTLETPFRIGSGQRLALTTDAPVVLDADGKPYIAGSSLRGVLRHAIEQDAPLLGCDSTERFFGKASDDDSGFLSRLTVEDAYLKSGQALREVRDHVRIDRRTGSAAGGAKFDDEVTLSGVFGFRAAYEGDSKDDPDLILLGEALRRLAAAEISIGGKTGAGFGRIHLSKCRHRAWQRTSASGLAGFFERRLHPDAGWQEGLPETKTAAPTGKAETARCRLDFDLLVRFDGPALVRAPLPPYPGQDLKGDIADLDSYGVRGEQVADSVFVSRRDTSAYYWPGTSLRGVLRSQAERIVGLRPQMAVALLALFGGLEGKDKHKGAIQICDGELTGNAQRVYLDHVAIDRITAAAADSAKFSVCALASPTFRFKIRLDCRRTESASIELWGLLLRDLMTGRIWAGAGTTRGYGCIRGTEVESASCSVPWAAAAVEGAADVEQRAGRTVVHFKNLADFHALAPMWRLASQQENGL